jgi:hypothetical protein
VDVYVSDIASKRKPKIETNCLSYELYEGAFQYRFIISENLIKNFWLSGHPFIRDFGQYKFEYEGKLQYQGRNLIKVHFEPIDIHPYRQEYSGTIYIAEHTNAFVFIEYHFIPNKVGFYKASTGNTQRINSVTYRIQFSEIGGLYNIDQIISTCSLSIKSSSNKVYDYYTIFNFFTQNTALNVDDYVVDSKSLNDLMFNTKGKDIDKLMGKENSFMLETSDEKELKEKTRH